MGFPRQEYWSGLPLPSPGGKNGYMYMYNWVPSLLTWNYHNTVNRLSVQFSCSVLSNSLWSMDCCMPGFTVLHHLLEFAQTHAHQVGDAIQLSNPLLPPSPPAFNLSQHQGLFQWVSSSHQVAKNIEALASASVLPVNIQGWFLLGLSGLTSLLSEGFSRIVSNSTVQKHQFFGAQYFLGPNSHIHT